MKKLLLLLLPLYFFLLPSWVSAQSRLTYPIADLGYCRDAKECYLYCEIPENKAACWSYGKYKLGSDVLGVTTMSTEEKQMMESKARQYNITFPIAQLGGCTGPQECRDFCENLANQSMCMDFAKQKGFQKEMETSDGIAPGKRDKLLEQAKTELGCTSMESCKKICETDQSRCEAFAKKHGAYREPPESAGRYSAERKQELMKVAQIELGCISMEECKSACEKNSERCMNFAKKHGFDRPEPRERQEEIERPEEMEIEDRMEGAMAGKCDSEDSCKTYCQEHPNECPGFREKISEGMQQSSDPTAVMNSKTNYVGPSGCRTEAECKNWCNDHPDKCPGFSEAKTHEESSKREYELRKKEMERSQETQKRQFEEQKNQQYQNYQPPQYNRYPSPSTQPTYNTIQPSSGSYTPPPTTSLEGSGGSPLPVAP